MVPFLCCAKPYDSYTFFVVFKFLRLSKSVLCSFICIVCLTTMHQLLALLYTSNKTHLDINEWWSSLKKIVGKLERFNQILNLLTVFVFGRDSNWF